MQHVTQREALKDKSYRQGGALTGLTRKLRRNVNDYGGQMAFRKGLAFLLRPFYQKVIYYLYELDLNTPKRQTPSRGYGNYHFKMLSPTDTSAIAQIEAMEEWLKGTLAQRLKANCQCMALFEGDAVIGFNYAAVGEGNIPLLRLKVLTGPTQAWSEQISIAKAYRRKGLASLMRQRFYQELQQKGITALFGHRQWFNVASRQSARKYTRQILAKVDYIKLLKCHRLKFYQDHETEGKAAAKVTFKPNHKASDASGSTLPSVAQPLFIIALDQINGN